MYKQKTILALIPARGGSKGLPRKNIKILLRKPLIAWSIEQALASRYLDEVIVSTEDSEIARIAKRYDAKIPFMRPEKLARDNSSSIDVILHALDWFRKKGKEFDYLALIEPTSPLRETDDIDNCIRLLLNHRIAKSIVSIARLESAYPEFNVIIDKNTGFIKKVNGKTKFNLLRRQNLEDIYFFEGTIYLSEVKTLLKKKTFYHSLTLPYVVPRWKSLEIDEFSDFLCVEVLLRARRKKLL